MYDVPTPPKDFVFEFASFLLKSNSLRFGVFTLASGKQSAYYIDLRMLPSFPGYFRLGINALKNILIEKIGRFDILASVPTSGLVFGSALAYEMNKPFIYARKELKVYGTHKMIEGFLEPGSKVIIVDALYEAGLIDENALESVLKQMVTQGEYEID